MSASGVDFGHHHLTEAIAKAHIALFSVVSVSHFISTGLLAVMGLLYARFQNNIKLYYFSSHPNIDDENSDVFFSGRYNGESVRPVIDK